MTTLRIHRNPWNGTIDFLVAMESYGGAKHAVAEPLTFRTIDQGERLDPTFQLSMGNAQALMDELWAAGIRPTDHQGAPGQLAATEKHLADMRWLAMTATKQLLGQQEKAVAAVTAPPPIWLPPKGSASLDLPPINGLGRA